MTTNTQPQKPKRKQGTKPSRPWKWIYTEELGEEICERISQGETLPSICRDQHMPSSISTIYGWLANNLAFEAAYTRARIRAADSLIDKALDASDAADSKDNANVARVKADVAIRVAAKLNPHKYSERLQLDGDIRVQRMTDEQIDKRITYLAQKLALEGPKGGT